jgi:APA family basic amino acid/polyamine antiporter
MRLSGSAELRRVIRLPHATAMVVGTIIGASIFVQPAEIARLVPSIPGVLLVWLAAGALTLIGALVCAELAAAFAETGGVYVYLREAFGPSIGFLWGWAMFWSIHSGIIAAIAVIFARYSTYFAPFGPVGTKVVAIGAILLLSAINYLGVKQGSTLQTLFTLGKLLAILLIVVVGFAIGPAQERAVSASTLGGNITLSGLLTALVAGLFAFGGWHMVTYNAGETVEPRKTIPRALMLGTVTVTLCYVAMNAVYLRILPLETVASSSRIAADAADALFGFGGGAVMSGIVLFSTFGALAGIVLAGPRVYLRMAKDGLLFSWLGAVHPRYRTPHRAIVVQGIWSTVLVATGTFRELFTRVIYTEWIFFGMMTIGLFLLRRAGRARRYSTPGYPLLPALFVLASFAIVANQLATNTVESVLGLALVLAGLPVYHLWARRTYLGEQKT